MKKDLKAILEKLDRIEENQMGQLQGGFAAVNGNSGGVGSFAKNTNCKGANCIAGCGGNFVVGCGVKQ